MDFSGNHEPGFESMVQTMDSIDEKTLKNDNALKAKIFASAQRLCRRLESPWERIAKMYWGEPFIAVSIQIANNMNLFRILHEQKGPKTADELSRATQKDLSLVKRILRTLSAAHVLEQHGSDTYFTTPFSEAMITAEAVQAIDFLFEGGYPYFASIPEYIQATGFITPINQGVWQNFRDTDTSVYEWFGAYPKEMANFVGLMKVWSATQESWIDLYPTDSLLENPDNRGPILVDVAGGGGRDIEAFLQKHPQSAGKLILQDRPEEVEAAKVSNGIERMAHDMFTPQPVKGARTYYLHTILHNYTDEKARIILSHLKGSMKPGYSKILVYEDTISDRNPTELSCGMDLMMMATFGTSARTESEWKSLFDSVGLKLVKNWQSSRAGQCLMELELPE